MSEEVAVRAGISGRAVWGLGVIVSAMLRLAAARVAQGEAGRLFDGFTDEAMRRSL